MSMNETRNPSTFALVLSFSLSTALACGEVVPADADAGAGADGGNASPVAMAESLSTVIDVDLSATLQATDADNDTLSFSVSTQPTSGTLSLAADSGAVTYTPNSGFVGDDSFAFTVNDGIGDSMPATVTIDVFGRTDGSFDTSFGTGGLTSSDFLGVDAFSGLMAQADGSIVCVGTSENGFLAARYTPSGLLDTTFGTGGTYTSTPNGSGYATFGTVAERSDGKLVMGGQLLSGDRMFALARFSADGKIDTSFGTNGMTTMVVGSGGSSSSNDMLVLADNKILLAGYGANGNSGEDLALARYSADGVLDSSFGTAGITLHDVGGFADRINAMALDSNGNVVVAGYALDADGRNFLIARFTADGVLDTSFGTGGVVLPNFGGNSVAYDVILDSAGRILVAGTNGNDRSVVFRLDSSGALDTSFGDAGSATVDTKPGENDSVRTVIEQLDGTILAVGMTIDGNDVVASLFRLDEQGVLDTSFGTGGVVLAPIGVKASDLLADAIMLPDGKVVAVGWDRGTDLDAAIMRFGY